MSTLRPIAVHNNCSDQDAGGTDQHRRWFTTLGLGTLAISALPLAMPGSARAADSGGKGKAKIVFVLFRRQDLTHEQSMAEWIGDKHVALVRKVPELQKWVQNHPTAAGDSGTPDGIGELYFADAEAMAKAMNSPEMAAAGEDAKRFLDMEKTFAMVVSERTLIG
jgi:uncharacterized protein (TIGR02118 family)